MKQRAKYLWLAVVAPLACFALSNKAGAAGVVVHEWGTFTSLQDESGKALGGINTDDEPVPKFVHRLADVVLISRKPGELNKVNAGAESLATFGVPIPKSYQDYLELGRFRNALLLEEESKHPSPGLASFISDYRLEAYKPVELSGTQSAWR